MESSSVGNRTSDNKIGRPRSDFFLSRVWLQTELDYAKSYYQFIIKNYNFREKKNSQGMKERENLQKKDWLVDLNYNY